MKRLITTIVLAFAGLSLAFAQTAGTPAKPESNFQYEPIRKGDQFIRMGLGPSISLFNLTPDGIETDTKMKMGGTGTVGYSRFINTKVALGGEIAFSFNPTLGENLYFYLPLTFKATYAFVFNRIHVPVSLATGFAFQTYNSTSYFGPILKPEAGAYFQYSPDWSFGVSLGWNIIPQWYKDGANNRTGNILESVIGVRYHF